MYRSATVWLFLLFSFSPITYGCSFFLIARQRGFASATYSICGGVVGETVAGKPIQMSGGTVSGIYKGPPL
jgi:hypothetical protein